MRSSEAKGLKRGPELPLGNIKASEHQIQSLETSFLINDPIKAKNLKFKVNVGKVSCPKKSCSLHKGNASLDRVKPSPKGGGCPKLHF